MLLDAVESDAARWCWPRLAVLVWGVVLLAVFGRLLLHPGSHDVYSIYRTAAQHWADRADLYWPHQPHQGPDHFRYSPVSAMLLTPTLLLPERAGAVLWRLGNTAVFLLGMLFWIRLVLPDSLTHNQTALLFLLIIPLSVGSLNNGQSNTFMTGLLLAGTAGVAAGRWNVAAACLALATWLKGYPLAIDLLLVLLYPVRLAPRFLVALVVLFVLSVGVQAPDYAWQQYGRWIEQLSSDDRSGCAVAVATCDWRLLARGLGQTVTPQIYMAVQALVGGAVAVWCAARFRAGYPARSLLTATFGLAACWMTVFGPATESCTYILLAPVLAWAVLRSGLDRRAAWWNWLPLGSLCLFVLHQMALWFPGGGRVRALGLQPFAGLELAVWLILTIRGDRAWAC